MTLLRLQSAAQRVGRNVVDECALAVDLDHREPLPVARLELGVAGDVDLLERERQLRPDPVEDGPRALAQVASAGDVEDDAVRYG